ncbi:nicotinamide N-methyltransferase-like [Pseudophryne corroboree]|uniref:nicotinamide N-methyltransferase-like n=1 Tax=Pseudophryne corroboree TaxID=495146 RepID=UPI003081D87E
MDSSSHKFYPVHGFDSREHLETYFSNKPEVVFGDDITKFPMECLHRAFSEGGTDCSASGLFSSFMIADTCVEQVNGKESYFSTGDGNHKLRGHIKGELLIDISTGAFIHHLYTASGYFKQICALKCSEQCIMELNKWNNKRTGAFDWSHIIKHIKCLEGNSDLCQDKDITLNTAITKIMKCDTDKENLTDPEVLPPADCVISAVLLEFISKDQNDYIGNFRKFVKLLKPEGYLILFGALNTTYAMIGQDKVHVFKYDESFVRKVLIDEGFIIDHWAVQKRTAVSDLIDYKEIIFITARRE